MKVNFNNNGKGKQTSISKGSFEDMVKLRKKQLPGIQESIQECFEDYDGGLVAVIRVKEDENGHSESHQVFIGGVAHISSQLEMGKALSHASDQMRELLLEGVAGDPKAMKSVLSAIAEHLLNDMKER